MIVPSELDGARADLVVARLAGVSRATARAMVDTGSVTVAGVAVGASDRLAAGTELVVPPVPEAEPLRPEPVPFGVVWEDDEIAVVEKPAGIAVHPGAGRRHGTLVSGLLERWPFLQGVGEADRWGLVHRLDIDTSGVLLVAKSAEMLAALQKDLAERAVKRTYQALVVGTFDIETGTIDAPIGRDPAQPTRMATRPDGRPARTHYVCTASWAAAGVTLLDVDLETGRIHQIRTHFASIWHPVVGDRLYGAGPTAADPGRVWLHARRISFRHPTTGAVVEATAALPEDLAESLVHLGLGD